MAHAGATAPKRLRRLDLLVGDENDEQLMFYCWRYLGVEPDKYRDLPWWKLHVAVNGFMREHGIEPPDPLEPSDGSLESLAAAGFTTRQA